MKKIVKMIGLMTIAAALFMSCKPSTDDPAASEPAAGTENENKEPETFSYTVDFTKAKVEDAYCIPGAAVIPSAETPVKSDDGTIIVGAAEDGALQIAGYYWDSYKMTFDAVDLSKATKVIITAKSGSEYTAPDALIFEIASGTKANGASKWTDASFLDLTDEYAEYTLTLDKFSGLGDNSKYDGALDDYTAIDGIGINPRGATGAIYIKSIVFAE